MLTTTLTALLLSALVNAQDYGGAPPAQTTASTSAPAVPSAPPSTSTNVNINVAPGGNFVFDPANVTASNGTIVTFFFAAANNGPHSVTQSSFANPCTYLAASNGNPAGFDSGLQLAKQFSINITDDSQPIWFHCKQVTHCGMGMVGSINAPSTGNNTFDHFKAAAIAIGSNEKTESDTGAVTGGFNAIATASPAATISSGSSSSSSDATKVVASAGIALLAAVITLALA